MKFLIIILLQQSVKFSTKDKDDQFVYPAESPYFLQKVQDDFPEVNFSFSSEVNK